MNTPSTPQSRSAAAATTSEIPKPITPSQIPLPSTPISTSKPAADLTHPQTPIPNSNSTSSIEKFVQAAQIPLPDTPTPVAATSSDVPPLVPVPNNPNKSTPHPRPHFPPKPNRQSILASPTPTPDISPLKLSSTSSSSLSQCLSRHTDYRHRLSSPAESGDLEEGSLLKEKDE